MEMTAEEYSVHFFPNRSTTFRAMYVKAFKEIQADALKQSLAIADTFALNHKLSAPEVIVAIQIREAIEKLVKDIEK